MSEPLRKVHPVLTFASRHRDENLSLEALAGKASLSTFHLHRLFSAVAGETPKQYTLRLRLERAVVLLLNGKDSVLKVALDCGFQSHEAFCRAFRRRFGMSPGAYRARGFTTSATPAQSAVHGLLVTRVGPCVRLFGRSSHQTPQGNEMDYTITKREVTPQPVLIMRRRVTPAAIGTTLMEVLPRVFQYAQQTGAVMAGQPFTRYVEWGPGLVTIEAGMPLATPAVGQGDILSETLPGGAVASTTHAGPYEKLVEAHAALQVWIEEQGLKVGGAPWEVYVTDPADHPDPKDWKTDVYWPIAQ